MLGYKCFMKWPRYFMKEEISGSQSEYDHQNFTAPFRRDRNKWVHNLSSLNQTWLRTSSALGLSSGSYLNIDLSNSSTISPSFSLNSSSFGFSLSKFSSSDSRSANMSFPGFPPTIELYNLPDTRKYFSYRGHARVQSGGRAPRQSIMSSKCASSSRSGDLLYEGNRFLPVMEE